MMNARDARLIARHNLMRYCRLLATDLTDVERNFIHHMLAVGRSASFLRHHSRCRATITDHVLLDAGCLPCRIDDPHKRNRLANPRAVIGILMLKEGDDDEFDLGSNRRNGKSKAVNLRMIETIGGE